MVFVHYFADPVGMRSEARKYFFFEKKKQKTFSLLVARLRRAARTQIN
jgi:hypothetical protein